MKRSKKLIALAAALAVVCVATVVLTQYEEKQEAIKNSGETILSIDPDTVNALSWEFIDGGLAFHKDDTGWHYDDDAAFPVSEQAVNDILAHFESFSAAFIIENVTDYAQYGLDDPDCVITLDAGSETYTVKLGDLSEMDAQRYVDIGDGRVYLVKDDPTDFLATALSGMIRHDDTPVFETVKSIVFEGEQHYQIGVAESGSSYSEEDIYSAAIGEDSLDLDSEKVTEYLNTVTGLELLNYETYNATDKELAACGLDSPELSVTVHYSETDEEGNETENACTLHIARNPDELEAYEKAEAEGAEELPAVTKYVRVGDSPILYQLSDDAYDTLSAAAYNDLRHDAVFRADFSTVTQLDITLEGQTHALIPEEETEDERHWYCGEEEIVIADIQTALEALSADSFTEEAPSGKEELRVTAHLDNEAMPQVEICLYRYDGSLCLATVNGESVSLVERSAVMELVEAVQAIVLN